MAQQRNAVGRLARLTRLAVGMGVAVMVTACGSSGTKTPAPQDSGAGSGSNAAGSSSQASGSDRDSLIQQFPSSVQASLALLPTPLVSALLKVRKSGPKTLVWADAGGDNYKGFQEAFINTWTQITGWKVQDAVPSVASSLAQLQAQVGSGQPQWDIFATLDDATAAYLADKGDLEKLDMSLIPTQDFPDGTRYDKNGYWTEFGPFGTVLAWNTKVWPLSGSHPTKVSDLFDTANFPGKRCIFNFPQYSSNLEFALMADGVPFSQVYSALGTKEGLSKAFAKLSSIKKDLVFVTSGADSVQFLLNGECDLGITWNGRVMAQVKSHPNLSIAMAWDGGLMTTGPLAIPKNAKHADAARTLIAFADQPQQECNQLNALGYGLVYKTAPFPSCLSKLAREWGPQYDQVAGWTDNSFYLKHPELIDAWTNWQTG